MDFLKLIKEAGAVKGKLKKIGEDLGQQEETLVHSGVTIKINGKGDFLGLHLEEGLLKDKAGLEGILLEAVNKGVLRSRKLQRDSLKGLVGGMDIPGFPF